VKLTLYLCPDRPNKSSSFGATIIQVGPNGSLYITGPLSSVSCLSVTLVYCGQTVGWIKIPLGTELGLSPGDTVLSRGSVLKYNYFEEF